MTCTNTAALGAYLLGALEPEERSIFEVHMSGCDICRTELVRLAPLPGLLHQISLADFDDLHEHPLPPAPIGDSRVALLEPLAAVAESPPAVAEPPVPPTTPLTPDPPDTSDTPRPRKRYWRMAAAAALVVVLTIGAALGYRALMEPSSSPPAAEGIMWSATNPATGVRADVMLINRTWGTEFRVWMTNSPPDKYCRLIVQAKPGTHEKDPYREAAGWWATDHAPGEDIPGATSIVMADIYKLEFIVDKDAVLVDIHPPER